MHEETITSACLRLIKSLGETSFCNNFYLVGGTALSLQLGHRHSIDLDFFSHSEFDPMPWLAEVKRLPVEGDMTIQPNHLKIDSDDPKTEFIYFAYPPQFDLVEWHGIKLMTPRDIGLFKILAILGRNRKKDIIDLYFIDRDVEPLDELVLDFIEKYDPGDVNLLRQVETLFDDEAVEQSDMPMMLVECDWPTAYKHVKKQLSEAIRKHLGL